MAALERCQGGFNRMIFKLFYSNAPRFADRAGSFRLLSVFCLCLLVSPLASARTSQLVADINQQSIRFGASIPLADGGDKMFFAVATPDYGDELWVMEAGETRGRLVKDINPGIEHSTPRIAHLFNGGLYFFADDGIHGNELWKTDGTSAGTELVKDIHNGPLGSFYYIQSDHVAPQGIVTLNNAFYFPAFDGVEYGLWKSDGTTAGTGPVKLFSPKYRVDHLTLVGSNLLFIAYDDATGFELWKSDGTAQGTRVIDLTPGTDSSALYNLTAVGSTLFFQRRAGGGNQLWKSDGTEAGTLIIADESILGSSSLEHFFSTGSALLFHNRDPYGKGGLWVSDGTGAGTILIHEVSVLARNGPPFARIGANVYFLGYIKVSGFELWKTDGTAGGTVMVKDINTGAQSSSPASLTTSGDRLYFVADDGVNGLEPWSSDGSEAGTQMLKDVRPGSEPSYPDKLMAGSGGVFFRADRDGINGSELWKSDGTPAGTIMTDIVGLRTGDSAPNVPVMFKGKWVFTADDGIHGRELWTSDGTSAGTRLLKDVVPGANDGGIRQLTVLGDHLYFTARFGATELWRTDGTPTGTVPVLTGLNIEAQLLGVGGKLYFSVTTDAHGRELWTSDGSLDGSMMVKDIKPGTVGSSPYDMTAFGTQIVFNVTMSPGPETWISDGTPAGTVKLADFHFDSHTVVGNTMYMVGRDSVNGSELWKTNGTAAGTVLVKDICPGSEGSAIYEMTNVGDVVYFPANDCVHSTELWRSDGTASGTYMVRDIHPGRSVPQSLTAVGDSLYFSAVSEQSDMELWKSDGTAAGTMMVKDIWPGIGASVPYLLTAVGDMVYFTAVHEKNIGWRIWRSDGTEAGTVLVDGLSAGGDSGYNYFTVMDDMLVFDGDDGFRGRELWKLFPDADGDGIPDTVDLNPTSSSSVFADLNGDAYVDSLDLGILMSYWGKTTNWLDLDSDGTIGSGDLSLLSAEIN